MNKTIIFFSTLLPLAHGIRIDAAPSARERKNTISSHVAIAYIEGFGAESDSVELMKQDTIIKIKKAIEEVHKFVFDSLWMKSYLGDAANTLQKENNKLI